MLTRRTFPARSTSRLRVCSPLEGTCKELHLHAPKCSSPDQIADQLQEGSDAAYGQALFPVPALDPNDPLQV